MINTCYDLGLSIDRDITSSILEHRYNLHTVWEGDGYPGVRVLFYYNTKTIGTLDEGKCICTIKNNTGTNELVKCAGKGSGDGENQCRKISIAIFQSGKVIIAGGCKSSDPIFTVYNGFNKIIKEIASEIRKINTRSTKQKNMAGQYDIPKSSITNLYIYEKILKIIYPSD